MRLLALAACLTAASLASSRAAINTPVGHESATIEFNAGCKPTAPIELELLRSAVVNGIAEFDYVVRPTINTTALLVHVETNAGAELLRHDPADTFGITKGEARTGSARVQLPADFAERGVTVELVATMKFDGAGDDGSTSVETQSLVRLIHFGAASEAEGVTAVTSGGEASLDMPAARTEAR